MRDPFFKAAYGAVTDSFWNSGVIRGSLFWEWDHFEDQYPGIYGIHTDDSTWRDHIQPHAGTVHYIMSEPKRVEGCQPSSRCANHVHNRLVSPFQCSTPCSSVRPTPAISASLWPLALDVRLALRRRPSTEARHFGERKERQIGQP